MSDQFENAVELNSIVHAIRKCRVGVSYKGGVNDAWIHALVFGKRLRDDILRDRYRMRKGTLVKIYRPKPRVANAPFFRDRVWQRSMCDNGLYDDLTAGLIEENFACQKGKGTDKAIRHIVRCLQELWREDPNSPIYGDHLDIRKFFPSTPHIEIHELERRRVMEPRFLQYLHEIVESQEDPRPQDEIYRDPFGARGTGLGSQINQLVQIALLDDLDHDIKKICRHYARYNDDFLVLSHNRDEVESVNKLIRSRLADKGLTMTDKCGIFTVDHGFYFMRKRFILTSTGKIVIRLHKDAMADERHILRCLKYGVDHGERSMEDVKRHYQSWISMAEYCGDAPIMAMDKFYTELFRSKPIYKRKKRYLYGKPQNYPKSFAKNLGARKGKCAAQRCVE